MRFILVHNRERGNESHAQSSDRPDRHCPRRGRWLLRRQPVGETPRRERGRSGIRGNPGARQFRDPRRCAFRPGEPHRQRGRHYRRDADATRHAGENRPRGGRRRQSAGAGPHFGKPRRDRRCRDRRRRQSGRRRQQGRGHAHRVQGAAHRACRLFRPGRAVAPDRHLVGDRSDALFARAFHCGDGNVGHDPDAHLLSGRRRIFGAWLRRIRLFRISGRQRP
jgi:hypothetical protein